jgi:mono/diheme cytochrome c family protein
MRRGRLILFLSLVLSSGAAACKSGGDEWGMPPSAKDVPNPVPARGENLAAVQAIYEDRCARCHGDHGAGDGPDATLYKPLPASLTDDKTRGITDGELFWRISKGRRPMPAYENELPAEQRWQMVNLLRSFAAEPAAGAAVRPAVEPAAPAAK